MSGFASDGKSDAEKDSDITETLSNLQINEKMDNQSSNENIDVKNTDGLLYLQSVKPSVIDLILTDPPYIISKKTGMDTLYNTVKQNKEDGIDFVRTEEEWNTYKGKSNIEDNEANKMKYMKYGTPYGKKYCLKTDYGAWDSDFTMELLEKFVKEFYEKLRNGGTLIVFFDIWKISHLKEMLERCGFKQLRFIEWVKSNPQPLNSTINYLTNCREIALVAVKGSKPTFNSSYDNGVYKYPIQQGKNRFHPTQKSLALFENLIKKHTNKGDVVLDTFLGSGTTALACKNTNRIFIGCELDKEYYLKAMNILGMKIEYNESETESEDDDFVTRMSAPNNKIDVKTDVSFCKNIDEVLLDGDSIRQRYALEHLRNGTEPKYMLDEYLQKVLAGWEHIKNGTEPEYSPDEYLQKELRKLREYATNFPNRVTIHADDNAPADENILTEEQKKRRKYIDDYNAMLKKEVDTPFGVMTAAQSYRPILPYEDVWCSPVIPPPSSIKYSTLILWKRPPLDLLNNRDRMNGYFLEHFGLTPIIVGMVDDYFFFWLIKDDPNFDNFCHDNYGRFCFWEDIYNNKSENNFPEDFRKIYEEYGTQKMKNIKNFAATDTDTDAPAAEEETGQTKFYPRSLTLYGNKVYTELFSNSAPKVLDNIFSKLDEDEFIEVISFRLLNTSNVCYDELFLFECNIRGENACVPVWKHDINTSSPFAAVFCSNIKYHEDRDPDCEENKPLAYKEVAALCFEEYRHDVALKLKREYGEYFARKKGIVISPELVGLEKLGVDKLLEVLRSFGYYSKGMKNTKVDIKHRRQQLYDDIAEEYERANTTDIKKKKALELIASLGVRKSPEKKSRPARDLW